MKHLILALYILSATICRSQDIIPLSQKNGIYIFDTITQILSSKKMICLGEHEHYIETFSEFKTKLIKHLHKNQGFEVVAFEGSLFNILHSTNNINSDTLSVKEAFYSTWQTNSLVDLMRYSKQQTDKSPWDLSGFDIQPSLSNSCSEWLKKLFISNNSLYANLVYKTDTTFINTISKTRESIRQNKIIGLSTDEKKALTDFYTSLSDSLKTQKNYFIQNKLLNQHNYNLILHEINNRISSVYFYSITDFYKSNQFRDSIMYQNMRWLITDFYREKKMIFWAHDAHISKKTIKEYQLVNHSSIEMLPANIKDQILAISLNKLENAPKNIRRKINKMTGNCFFITNPNYLNGAFEYVVYFKKTESNKKYKLR